MMGCLDCLWGSEHTEEEHEQSNAHPVPVPPTTAQHHPGDLTVFAHFIVGNAAAMTPEQWEYDIIEAQKAHIDGFAMNIGPQDDYTDRVLHMAYDVAGKIGNFSMFLSFDYGSAGPWPIDRVIGLVNTFKDRPAQFLYQNKPMVSTFEGAGSAEDWRTIKAETGCMFIPNWTSLGPAGMSSVWDIIDGAFSWDSWPTGAQDKDTVSDEEWIRALAGKPYMMPVSPWFYTNLPQWQKNWLWRGDDLWHYRWRQVMDIQPTFIQILTWNDYGEAHYIGPIYEPGVPDGAMHYVADHPHDAWRTLLPHYIDAYRRKHPRHIPPSNPRYPMSYGDKIVYWYRLNPNSAGSTGGTTGNNPEMGQPELPPGEVSQDRVFVSVMVAEPSDIYVHIGANAPTRLWAQFPGINHFSVPFNGQTGPVKIAIVRNQQAVKWVDGPPITDQCATGIVDWNAFVGSSE